MLPPGLALNVNFPDRLAGATWRLTRIGTYKQFHGPLSRTWSTSTRRHGLDPRPGVAIQLSAKPPTPAQKDDEAVVVQKDIAVSVMQIGYEPQPGAQQWARRNLRGFLQP